MWSTLKMLAPGRTDHLSMLTELVLLDKCRLPVQQQVVCAVSIVAIRVLQIPCFVRRQYVVFSKGVELSNVISEFDNSRILCSVRQHEVLHEEFYVADAADSLV